MILFSHNVSSDKTDWILTELPLPALSVAFYITRVSSLMNALVWECFREISINVNKLFIMYFVYIRPCRIVVACLFLCPLSFGIKTLLLYFCLFVNHVNKPIIFVFTAFVYYFKNTISIFVTVWMHMKVSEIMNMIRSTFWMLIAYLWS